MFMFGSEYDDEGNVYCWGQVNADGVYDMDPSEDEELFSLSTNGTFLVKISPNYELGWVVGFDDALIQDVAIHESGELSIAVNYYDLIDFDPGPGEVLSEADTYRDAVILNLSSTGLYQSVIYLGSDNPEDISSIEIDPSGNIIVAGYFNDEFLLNSEDPASAVLSNGSWDNFVLKFNSDWDYMWGYSSGSDSFDYISNLTLDSVGNPFVHGGFYGDCEFDPGNPASSLTPAGDSDLFVLSLTAEGDFNWVTRFGGGGDLELEGQLHIDQNGDLLCTGSYIGGSFSIESASELLSIGGSNNTDVFISKIDTDTGNPIWCKSLTSNRTARPTGIDSNAESDIFMTGWYDGILDLDPGESTINSTDAGLIGSNFFVCRLTPDGDHSCSFDVGNDDRHQTSVGVFVTDSEAIVVTGVFEETVDFDPGEGVTSVVADTPVGGLNINGDGFIAEYILPNCTSTDIIESDKMNAVRIYPNPTQGFLKVENDEPGSSFGYQIVDSRGRLYLEGSTLFSTLIELPAHMDAGIYFVRISKGKSMVNRKLIIMQ